MKDEGKPPFDLGERTLRFASMVIEAFVALPRTDVAMVLGKQMLRVGTSPGSQYRESCRARSTDDKISKIEGALHELDQTDYWVELLHHHQIMPSETARAIQDEAHQLIAILVSIVVKLKGSR